MYAQALLVISEKCRQTSDSTVEEIHEFSCDVRRYGVELARFMPEWIWAADYLHDFVGGHVIFDFREHRNLGMYSCSVGEAKVKHNAEVLRHVTSGWTG